MACTRKLSPSEFQQLQDFTACKWYIQFKFAFMGKFLHLYRFVSTTTLDQPALLDDLNLVLNPQLGTAEWIEEG